MLGTPSQHISGKNALDNSFVVCYCFFSVLQPIKIAITMLKFDKQQKNAQTRVYDEKKMTKRVGNLLAIPRTLLVKILVWKDERVPPPPL